MLYIAGGRSLAVQLVIVFDNIGQLQLKQCNEISKGTTNLNPSCRR